eukprot:358734-Chlamydomonas_euryale.AAC.4
MITVATITTATKGMPIPRPRPRPSARLLLSLDSESLGVADTVAPDTPKTVLKAPAVYALFAAASKAARFSAPSAPQAHPLTQGPLSSSRAGIAEARRCANKTLQYVTLEACSSAQHACMKLQPASPMGECLCRSSQDVLKSAKGSCGSASAG